MCVKVVVDDWYMHVLWRDWCGGLIHTDDPPNPWATACLCPRQVFAGDKYAIDQARQQLRVEFMRHKDVRDPVELRKSVMDGWG